MKLRFLDKGHKYQSDNGIKWTSVTKLIHKYENGFNSKAQAYASSLNPNSKWFGMEVKDILSVWAKENRRSTTAGHWYHARMEEKALKTQFKEYKGHNLQVFEPLKVKNYKLAREQKLESGIYPEHLVYSTEFAVCGQVDLPYVYDRYVDILDYKTNKELKFEGYGGKMMRYGLKHLPDANYYHYCLQLSVYMRLILLANPHLKPGEMKIYHVTFENEGFDEFGFPILKKNNEGNFFPKKGKYHKVPYLEKEAIYMLKNNIAR
jgi:hypothetical protein